MIIMLKNGIRLLHDHEIDNVTRLMKNNSNNTSS